MKPDGSIDKFKARLAAKGFKQKVVLDFSNTFSPVTRITSIRLLIAIATIFYLKIHQMDVKMEPRRSKRARVENDFSPNYYVLTLRKISKI